MATTSSHTHRLGVLERPVADAACGFPEADRVVVSRRGEHHGWARHGRPRRRNRLVGRAMQLNTQKTRRLESLLIGETVPIDPNRVGFEPDRFGFRPWEHTDVTRASGHGQKPWPTMVASTCAREQEQTAETEGTDALRGTCDVVARVVARKNGRCTMGGSEASHTKDVPNFSIGARGCESLSNFKSACAVARLREPLLVHAWKSGGTSIANLPLLSGKELMKNLLVDERIVQCVPALRA